MGWLPVFLLLSFVVAPVVLASDAHEYLRRAAATYRHLKSFQADATAEGVQDVLGKRDRTLVRITLYTSGPDKIRIDTRDSDNSTRSVLLLDDGKVTEYHIWSNEYALLPSETKLDIKFSPARGVGFGEMTYDTITDGISTAVIRGRQTLELGADHVECVVVDVEYTGSIAKFSFWIMVRENLVLQRAVTYSDGSVINTVVSRVRALTANEEIPDGIFQFSPPVGAKEVPVSSWESDRGK